MFASIAAGYSREPLAGQPDVFAQADLQLAAGEITATEYAAVGQAFVREVLFEQEVSGLAILADGGVAHADRLRPLVEGLGGSCIAEQVLLPDGGAVARPRFDAPIQWRGPVTLEAWRAADAATDLLVKQVLVGPYTIGRLAGATGKERAWFTHGLAEALNAEIHALVAAGCPVIQVDEGALTSIEDDAAEWTLYAEVQRRLTAGLEDAHLSLGLYSGAVHQAGHSTIFDSSYRSYLVDVLAGPPAWRFVFAAPPERGLIAGVLDARLEVRDETEVLVWAMAWAAEGGRGPERVGSAANGSLTQVSRHLARRKIERLGEAVRIASMGPLDEVAVALDPDPAQSKMPELRVVGQAVEASRRPG